MDNIHVIELIPEYLDGVLRKAQRQKVEAHIKDCPSCAKELEALQTLFTVMEDDTIDVPSERMRVQFFEQLNLEKQSLSEVGSMISKHPKRKNPWFNNLLKIAASVILLIGAFLTGKYQSEEKSNSEITTLTKEKLEFKQTAMLSLLENQSASKRIQGVNYIETFANLDEAVLKALSNRMLYDENTNVRATAVEALSKFAESESVKLAFIKALGTEKNPSIQIAIIQTLVNIQESTAVAPMKQLLEEEGTQPFVRKEITNVLSKNIL